MILDQYFPADLDFSAYFNNDTASFDEGIYNEDMDYLLNLTDGQLPGNPGGSESRQTSGIPIKQEAAISSSAGDVIMIPPMITHRASDIKIKKESETSKAAIKGVVAMSKFSKTTKPLPLLPVSKFLSTHDSDDDSDDDRGKRLKFDPNDPQRNERR